MLCLNNFIIVGIANNSIDLANKISNISLKMQEFLFDKNRILVGFQSEKYIASNANSLLLMHGIFPDETPSSLLSKSINNFADFSKEYRYQGVIALINSKEKIIRVLGDPAGTRSIFYFVVPDVFIVTTDMKLLKLITQVLDIQLEQEILTLYEIVTIGYIVSRKTIFKNVNRLLPGETLTIQMNGGFFEYRVNRYWDMIPISSYDSREVVTKLLKSLINSLNSYCKEATGTEIAMPISGGIDSSLLLLITILKAEKCGRIRAIHVSLENYNELLLSKYVTVRAGTSLDVHVISLSQIKEKYIQMLSDLLKIIGYPREGDASLPYLALAQIIRERGIRFSIGGDDAVSIYGGYDYYKFYAAQLLLEKRIPTLLKLIKILRKYNYSHEKSYSIVLRILLQLILRFYPIRYQYFKLRLHRLPSIRNKRLTSLLAQYLAELSSVLYEAPAHNYYHEVLRKILIHKASHLVHTRVKAEEFQGIVTFLPYSLREIIELIMQKPPEYFFFPIGSKSLPRLILKYLGMPPAIYLQSKSGFDITTHILRDPKILSYMLNYINRCWVSKYIKIDKLNALQIHNLFNICIAVNS